MQIRKVQIMTLMWQIFNGSWWEPLKKIFYARVQNEKNQGKN